MPFDPKTIMAPTFHDVFDDIILGKHTHYWLKGGRGSTKSSFISLMIVLDIYESFVKFRYNKISPAELSNAICLRKVGSTIRHSLAPQIKWAIDQLGLNDFFTETASTFEFTLKYTGQKIILTGSDDPQKLKSIKPRVGYFKNIWYEELAEFSGMEEIRTILQSVMRGISSFRCFYSYNPPLVRQNWVNFESGVQHDNRLVHHSTYLDVPRDWLGEAFIAEAEQLKKNNPRAYEHEYLGVPTGTGGTVFENIEEREITDDEIQSFDRIKQGIDWGFSVDPLAFIRLHYDSTRKILYLIDEIYKTRYFNDQLMGELRRRGYDKETIIADGEEPKSISELWRNGFRIYKAEKGPGSIAYGIKFLQRLNKIVIDQKRTPNAYKEFILYEYEKNKDGTFRADYPDKMNHCLIAGTMITTDHGQVPIENIKAGDLVLTRKGFKKVVWSGVSGRNMPTYTLTTQNGRQLTATSNHKIYTSKGFCDIIALRYGDELCAEKQSFMKTNNGTDTQKRKTIVTDYISSAAAYSSITMFGRNTMENEKKDITSTTSMVTPQIIPLKILKRLHHRNILQNIRFHLNEKNGKENGLQKYDRSQKNGIHLKRGLNGIKTMLNKIISEMKHLALQTVPCAIQSLQKKDQHTSFAQTNVNRNTDEILKLTISQKNANGVVMTSKPINTQEFAFVRDRVQAITEEEIAPVVYDLKVDEVHEFFANGILVHNCIDATRYSLEKDMRPAGFF